MCWPDNMQTMFQCYKYIITDKKIELSQKQYILYFIFEDDVKLSQ